MSSRHFAFIRVFSSRQHLNLMDNPVYSHRRKLLLDDLRLRACPDVCHRYGINHSRLFRRLRPCRRIIICHVKVYISLDAWNLSTARVLPSRYIAANIGLVFLIRLVIKLHRAITFVVSSHPQPCPSKRVKVKPALLINIQPDI